MAEIIEVEMLTKRFGSTRVLADVELIAEEGKVLALLGPNGAGKTTLVRILATLLKPTSGCARVAGCDVVEDAVRLRSMIGLTGQLPMVDDLLTGWENLELVGLFHRLDKAERHSQAQEMLERFSLTDAADRLVKTYSVGMRRRLDVGVSLMGYPRVLFLDEPTAGLDPRTRNDVWQFVEELVAGGTTVLLTTQYMEEAERLANRIVVIDAGAVVARGTIDDLKNRVGGDLLEVHVTSNGDLNPAAALMTEVGQGTPRIDLDRRRVSVPAKNATQTLIAAGQRLQEGGIAFDDLSVRRPSLDDVFLSLTGHSASVQTDCLDGDSGHVPYMEFPRQPIAVRPTQRLSWAAAHDTGGIAKRNFLHIIRTPRLLIISVLQPVTLLLLFRYILGGAIQIPGGSYVDFIVPAVFIEAVMICSMATAVGMADDLHSGIIDRFRTLRMARSAVLAGRTLADLGHHLFSLTLMVGLGLLVGFSFHGSIGEVFLGLGIVLIFGYCFSWVYLTLGLLTKDPEAAHAAGILPFFILIFASSAIVPVATMPAWLQPFASHQPVSVTIDAVRALLQGEATHNLIWQSLAWSAGIFLVFSVIAVRLYHNATA